MLLFYNLVPRAARIISTDERPLVVRYLGFFRNHLDRLELRTRILTRIRGIQTLARVDPLLRLPSYQLIQLALDRLVLLLQLLVLVAQGPSL